MNTLEELLPGIEKFLCADLSTEELSVKAEKKRQFFVERLEVLRLQRPPSLPPRPDSLAKSPRLPPASPRPETRPPDVAALRELARSNVSTSKSDSLDTSKEDFDGIYEEFENPDNEEPESVPLQSTPQTAKPTLSVSSPTSLTSSLHNDDDLYEVPMEQQMETPPPTSKKTASVDALSDGDSGTSYESYEEEETEADASLNNCIYQNEVPAENIKLPMLTRVKNKKKKKSSSKEDLLDLSVSDLHNVRCSGELFHCGTFSWSKRFCVIADNRFICYKTDKDPKPLLNFPLQGYSISYIDKEGKRSHVVKISQDGSKTILFSADNKENIDTWIEHLRRASSLSDSVESITKDTRSNSQSSDVSGDKSTAAPSSDKVNATPVSNASCNNSSEGGSGDASGGSGGSTTTKMTQSVSAPSPYDTKEYISCRERKRITRANSDMPSLEKSFQKAAHWFGTFGKKKGEKKRSVFYAVEVCDFLEANPEVDMAGYVKILTDLGGPKKWCKRFCYVKNGNFICRKEIADESEEFSFRLSGCEVSDAHETRKELAVKVLHAGHEKFIIEPADALEQGNWLSILIRETGCAKLYTRRPPPPPVPDLSDPAGEFDQEYENIEYHAELDNSSADKTATRSEVKSSSHGKKDEDAKSEDLLLSNVFPSSEDLYDEVYQNSSENVMAFLESSVDKRKSDEISDSADITENKNESSPSPPPLPKSRPPPRPAATKTPEKPVSQSDYETADDWYDDVEAPETIDSETEDGNVSATDQAKLSDDEGEDHTKENEEKEVTDLPNKPCESEGNEDNNLDNLISCTNAEFKDENEETDKQSNEPEINTRDEDVGVKVSAEEGNVPCEGVPNVAEDVGKNSDIEKATLSDDDGVEGSAKDKVSVSAEEGMIQSATQKADPPANNDRKKKGRLPSTGSCADDEASKEELSGLRRKVLQTRKKRADLRAKKAQTRQPADKEVLEAEIRSIDAELKTLDEEVQKLQASTTSPRKPARVRSQKKQQSKVSSAKHQNCSMKTVSKTFTDTSNIIDQTVCNENVHISQQSNGHKPTNTVSTPDEQSPVETSENKTASTEELRPIVKERLKLWESISDKNHSTC